MLDAHHAIIKGLAEELHLRRCDFAWWITIDRDDEEDDWFIWEWTTITSIISDKHHTIQRGFAPITTETTDKTTDKTAYVTIKDGKFIITQSDEDHDTVSVSSHTPVYDPSFTPPSWTCDLGDPKFLEMLQHQLNTTSFSLDL